MNWDSKLYGFLNWSGEIANYDEKLEVAKTLAAKVKDGDVIGFGSGSTSFLAVKEIAARVKNERLSIRAIPTSREIRLICNELGIPVASLNDEKPDWSFDGADEVDSKLRLIKGRGGAMFNEKLVMSSAPKNYIMVDESKIVERLGSNFPVPVEVWQDALMYVKSQLVNFDVSSVKLRPAKGKDGPVITENNCFILDVMFNEIGMTAEKDLKSIPGVLETGLFIGFPVELIRVGA